MTTKNAGIEALERVRKVLRKSGFTLVELIVVITILAILATIGFLSLQGYSSNAKDSTVKSNMRILGQTLSNEAAKNNTSMRSYIIYNSGYTMTGEFLSGRTLVAGEYGTGNYTVGIANFAKLGLDGSKFKDAQGKDFLVGAIEFSEPLSASKSRTSSYFQVAASISDNKVAVDGNYPGKTASGTVAGIISDGSGNALLDSVTATYAGPGGSSGGGSSGGGSLPVCTFDSPASKFGDGTTDYCSFGA